MSSTSASSTSTSSSTRSIRAVCLKQDSANTMTDHGMRMTMSFGEAQLPPGKRVLATTAASSSSSDTTPTCSVAKRLKRVSIESSQDTSCDDIVTKGPPFSSSSGRTCSTDSSALSSLSLSTTSSTFASTCCACQCHQHQQQQDTLSSSSSAATAAAVPLSKKPQHDNDQDEAAAALVWEHVGYNSSSSSHNNHIDNNVVVTKKRQDYISWDDYFMSVAELSSLRSKDKHQPSGCCLVDLRYRIVGIGYNGFPAHCSDDCLPWWPSSSSNSGNNNKLHTKDPYVCHAEVNAILNKCSADVANCGTRLYVLDFPCNECAKVIIQAGLSEVIYLHDTKPDSDSSRASRLMFLQAGVKMRRHEPERMRIDLDFGKVLDDSSSATDDNSSASSSATSIPTTTTTTPSTLQSMAKIWSLCLFSRFNYFFPKAASKQQQYRDLMILEAKGYDPCKMPSGKRTDYISWDDYYMAVAFLTGQRSKDPSTQVGACIVSINQRIVGLGYNGFPAGCSDDHLPWARTSTENNKLHTKYPYVCHAEMNAILNKCTTDITGATLYVALFPCNECTKVIIQAGIRQVVYMSDKYHDDDSYRASRIMLQMAGVQMRKYIPSRLLLSIHLGGDSSEAEKQN